MGIASRISPELSDVAILFPRRIPSLKPQQQQQQQQPHAPFRANDDDDDDDDTEKLNDQSNLDPIVSNETQRESFQSTSITRKWIKSHPTRPNYNEKLEEGQRLRERERKN